MILESLLNVLEGAEQEMLDTLSKDEQIKKIISKEVEINNTNHIVFESSSNLSKGEELVNNAFEEWFQVFAKYLKNENEIQTSSFGNLSHKIGEFSYDFGTILNIRQEEVQASSKYDCKMFKNKIPHSGDIIL